jgi:hypothetical protein
LPNGSPGSGVKSYTYRYKLEGEPFTSWQTSDLPYFEVTGAVAGESVTVQSYVTDKVDNRSGRAEATITIPQAEEWEPLESEPEPYDGIHPDEEEYSQIIEAKSASEDALNDPGAGRRADGEFVFTSCKGRFSAPHYSRHAAEEGAERINSVYRLRCDGDNPIIKGFVLVALDYNGKMVAPQLLGYEKLVGPPPVRKKLSASAKCDKLKMYGKYRTVALLSVTINVGPEGDVAPKTFREKDYSRAVINPCDYSGLFPEF